MTFWGHPKTIGEKRTGLLEGILASDTIATAKNKHSLTQGHPLIVYLLQFLSPDTACVAFDKKFMRHTKNEKTI